MVVSVVMLVLVVVVVLKLMVRVSLMIWLVWCCLVVGRMVGMGNSEGVVVYVCLLCKMVWVVC